MDAQAYLLRHGWSGPGNPLNPNRRPGTHGGLGLTRPILVARRQGNQGVGKKTTKDHTNQWWLRGFEDALKGVGEENKSGAGETKRAPNALTSELYRFFVRGETVPGTLGGVEKKVEEGDKMEVDGEGKKETKEERRVRREEKRKRKEERAKRKEERRKRREAKEVRRAERREKKEKKRLLKEEKKKQKEEERRPEEEYPTPPATELEQTESSGRDESVVQEVKMAKKEKKEKSKKREAPTSDDGSKKKKSKKWE
ncbi:hypothetical protein BO94DRAFT_534549 [Aspergillus sclerotioniger CBS 115572]|uniref:G-patch domain-containing protein n=1 Tax=Aspergillus sclerotioniger CBS 115572 TaxID=1450535 RepID=A0A317WQF2_9EURO|nr:hypothetical protein BO94DRAFT_534549 [Aspergillus sclerotioniger CBS 115572]PWY88659.1 hypothetical protein BO94DRAFT_534549 [Aspergillus sclerotioniger CBS 115572]